MICEWMFYGNNDPVNPEEYTLHEDGKLEKITEKL